MILKGQLLIGLFLATYTFKINEVTQVILLFTIIISTWETLLRLYHEKDMCYNINEARTHKKIGQQYMHIEWHTCISSWQSFWKMLQRQLSQKD